MDKFDDMMLQSDMDEVERMLRDDPNFGEEFERRLEESMGDIMKDIMDRMDRKFEKAIRIPQPPSEDEKSAVSKACDECEEYAGSHPKGKLRIAYGDRNTADLLSLLGPKESYDYCKYLLLYDCLSSPKTEQTEALAKAWHERPEFLLYALTARQIELLTSLPKLISEGKTCQTRGASVLCALCLAGFDSKSGTLLVAADLPGILEKLSEQRIRKVKKQNQSFDEPFSILLKHYGLLEMNEVPGLLRDSFDFEIDENTCMKMMYWRYSFLRKAKTATTLDEGRHYIFEAGLDVERILKSMFASDFMADYRPMREEEIAAWKRSGDYQDAFLGWPYLYGMLMQAGLPKEDAREYCDEMYRMIRNGKKLKVCMERIAGSNPDNRLEPAYCMIWFHCVLVLIGTCLPGMKGACRFDAVRMPQYGMFLDSFFTDDTVEEKKIGKHTRLEELPQLLQIQIASRLFFLDDGDLDDLEEILKISPENVDMNYILFMACTRLDEHEKAARYIRKVDRLLKGKDPAVSSFAKAYDEGRSIRVPLVGLSNDGYITMR